MSLLVLKAYSCVKAGALDRPAAMSFTIVILCTTSLRSEIPVNSSLMMQHVEASFVISCTALILTLQASRL
jgi:hypothetical protein